VKDVEVNGRRAAAAAGEEGTILNDERRNGSADDFLVGRARAERALLVTIDVGART
jgi:hypothetical protein